MYTPFVVPYTLLNEIWKLTETFYSNITQTYLWTQLIFEMHYDHRKSYLEILFQKYLKAHYGLLLTHLPFPTRPIYHTLDLFRHTEIKTSQSL